MSAQNGMSIELDNLSFQPAKAWLPIFKSLNLNIYAGERVLIVGRSGSGKGVLLQLLAGMHQDFQGLIKINGSALRTLDLYSFRSQVGDIMEAESIFNGTLLENITMGRSIPPERVLYVLRRLNVLDAFNEKGMDLDAMLATNGQNLTHKLIASVIFARSLAHDPALLLIDETALVLDVEDYDNMLATILKSPKRRTIVGISNSTRSARHYQRVIYLEQGAIVDDQPYEEARTKAWFQALTP